ncbi:Guanylate cyclase 2G [Phlyctochytrium planicorne]|nr:Guanylate cyclase 2G [Phlyctochytrium planicorne]
MLDQDKSFRGPCNVCDCTEYAVNPSSQRCDECKHSASRHRIVDAPAASASRSTPPESTGKGWEPNILNPDPLNHPHQQQNSIGKTSWKEKMDAALESKKQQSGADRFITKSVICWVIITLCFTVYVLSGKHRVKKYNRGFADSAYQYAGVAFAIGSTFAYVGKNNARTLEKRSMSTVLFWINTIAMMTYAIHALRLSPTLSDATGKPMDPARFLEWFTTCPVTISMIGNITKNEKMAKSIVRTDFMLLSFGLIASTVKEPFSYLFSTCAVACFTYVFSGLWGMFTKAIDGETDCNLDPNALRAARAATCYSWLAFPITWHLQKSGLVSYEVGESMFCVADVFSKVFLTLILVNATVEDAQNAKVAAISTIASELESQMEHSDKLLGKLIPQSVLDQIKSGKATSAEEFQSVTVFFSDIANFTVISSRNSTKNMLATLNKLWVEYDAIAKRWGMYKVETIGDAYLGVTGAPDRVPDHAERAVNFSLDVIEMVKSFRTIMQEEIQIRVGLNSGPITAGILGEDNPHWCIVGDTVNTASRMESTSKAMQIHISESTFNLVKDKGFKLSPCEVMNVKGKGTMNTYWVLGR